MKIQFFIALKILVMLSILTGIAYPLLMTGVSQLIFPSRANGSLIMKEGKIIGSELIGQTFDSSAFFWSRPSAVGYNPIPSGGSNMGPSNVKLAQLVKDRRDLFVQSNHLTDRELVPAEMIYASASGLDPHISPEAAFLQLDRVADARKFSELQREKLRKLIRNNIENPQFTLLGEPRINVFELNLSLDNIK